jgi:copper resistance protein C
MPPVTTRAPRARVQRVRLLCAAATLLAACVASLAPAGPASAHDVLLSTDPADGAVVTVPPGQVKLTFAEQALAIGTRMRVTGPDGTVVSTAPVQVVGSYVTQPLGTGLRPGRYSVLWRVTSADGHPVSGSLSFTLAGSAAAAASDVAGPATAATTGGPATSLALLALAGLAAAIAVPVLLVRRRTGRRAPPSRA